jgi:predicted lactoylglutathione lyase
MIGYVTLGTNDLERAIAFYDALLGELGAQRFMDEPGVFQAWAVAPGQPALSVTKPWDGQAATHGNGTMVALAVDSPEKVDAIYRKAMELGAQDEGPAGPRSNDFYAGYFRDLDGNKLNVFYHAGLAG